MFTLTLSESVHPSSSVIVSVYTVKTVAVQTGFAQFVQDKPVAGDQEYVNGAFPEAGVAAPKVTEASAHFVLLGPAFALHCP